MDVPSRNPLPLELNCEIFKCLKLPIQRKFIGGLGRGIYGMFGQKLLIKVRNPKRNKWQSSNTNAKISSNGLNVSISSGLFPATKLFAEQGFIISDLDGGKFQGRTIYYYEVALPSYYDHGPFIGLSDGIMPKSFFPFESGLEYYYITGHDYKWCRIQRGENYMFELPEGSITWPERKRGKNINGCGILLYPNGKVTIFFTLNGQLLGKPIPIDPSVDHLYPTLTFGGYIKCLMTNFGNDENHPFEYDLKKCPGLGLIDG